MRRVVLPSIGLLAAAVVACSSDSGSVVLVGDSLAEQAAPYLTDLVDERDLVPQFFGGTAPCDWLGRDLQIERGDVVVVSFSGNSLTPCMTDGAGGFLSGDALLEKYRADVSALIDAARLAGGRVLLIGQPIRRDNDASAALNPMYRELVDLHGAEFVDAGASVENPDGTFALSLPCVAEEPECDASGSNLVRSDDGLHFCPGSPPAGPCAGYSSGAFRFAKAIADAVDP